MSTIIAPAEKTDVVPEPITPWKPSQKTKSASIIVFLVSLFLSAAIVLLTGLAGIDGFGLALFCVVVVVTSVRNLRSNKKSRRNAFVGVFVASAAMLAFFPWMSIFASVIVKGVRGLQPNFLVENMQFTTPDDELNMGGAAHAIIGSMLMVSIAAVITLPLGILSGVYLTEIRGRLTFLVRFVVQSMSGVPSIVAGLFVYTTFVNYTSKFSGMAGALALAVLMLPTVARTAEEVLKLVPDDLRSASYALGARQWRTSLMVVLPTVRSGLMTAVILGVARVIGETAPLLLTSLSNNSFIFNPLGGPIGSLPTYVFGLLQIGTENSINRAWTGSLVLLILVLVLFTTARYVGGKDKR